jgi:hypothetical protein
MLHTPITKANQQASQAKTVHSRQPASVTPAREMSSGSRLSFSSAAAQRRHLLSGAHAEYGNQVVLRMLDPSRLGPPHTPASPEGSGILLRRKCACGGSGPAKCECKERSQETLQRAAVQPGSPGVAPPIVNQVLRSPGQPLETSTRSFMEQRFGHDFSQVRVHMDTSAARSARAVNALAYTVGNHIVFGSGAYAAATHGGQRILAHELTHVVQQRAIGAGLPRELRIGDPHDAAEHQADRTASAVVTAGSVPGDVSPSAPLVQRAGLPTGTNPRGPVAPPSLPLRQRPTTCASRRSLSFPAPRAIHSRMMALSASSPRPRKPEPQLSACFTS